MPDKPGAPNLSLVLGYDPLQAKSGRPSTGARSDSSRDRKKRAASRSSPADSQTFSSPSSSSSAVSQAQRSRRAPSSAAAAANASRDSSRHLPVPKFDQPSLRDSISEDPFFQAYYEPGLKKLSDDWHHRLAREHESDRRVRPSYVSAGSSSHGKSLRRSSLGSRVKDSESQMPAIHIRVIGHRRVGKSSFIANALGVSEADLKPDAGARLDVDGTKVLVRVTERMVDERILENPEVMAKAVEQWNAAPERVDGAIIVYDVMNEKSTLTIPVALRAYDEANIPSLLMSTKGDSSSEVVRVNSDLFEKKAKLMATNLTVYHPSVVSEESARQCFQVMVQKVLLQQGESATSPSSRPSTGASSRRQQQSEASQRSRKGSTQSISSTREGNPSATSPPPSIHLPTPRLAAKAVEATRQAQSTARLSTLQDGSDPSLASFTSAGDEADDQADAAILATQQTLAQNIASFDDLVDQLARPIQHDNDAKFVWRFLAFYRMFASSTRLLRGLLMRCMASDDSDDVDSRIERIEHIFKVLSVWIKRFPGDFAAGRTADILDEFLTTFERGNSFLPYVENVRLSLDEVVETDDTFWGVMDESDSENSSTPGNSSSHSSVRPISPPQNSVVDTRVSRSASVDVDASQLFQGGSALTLSAMGPSSDTSSLTSARTKHKITEIAQRQAVLLVPNPRLPFTKDRWRQVLELPEDLIAREMTRIDWTMFSAVKPRELIRDVSVSIKERARFAGLENVTRMITHFNHIAYWTTNLVLLRDKPKHRAQMWEKLARVARKLRELNNYNSMGAIVAGMESTAVHRLAGTRELVRPEVQKDFMKIQILMSAQKGHFAYRMAWGNTSGARIPFIPLHRRDLVVAEQGNRTFVADESGEAGGKSINWTKFEIMGSVLNEIQRAQTTPLPNLQGSEVVKSILLHCMIMKDDDELYERSLALEPTAAGGGGGGHTATARRRLQPWLTRYGLSQ